MQEFNWDERESYPMKNRYLLQDVIQQRIPGPVETVVRDYFNKTFAAYPWVKFDSGLPRCYAIDIFLAWCCEYQEEAHFGKFFYLLVEEKKKKSLSFCSFFLSSYSHGRSCVISQSSLRKG